MILSVHECGSQGNVAHFTWRKQKPNTPEQLVLSANTASHNHLFLLFKTSTPTPLPSNLHHNQLSQHHNPTPAPPPAQNATTLQTLRCVFTISIGGAVIGIDEGIIATVIAQASFSKYMFPPNTKIPQQQQKQRGNTLLGAIGSLSAGFILAKYGRKAL